MKTVIGTWLILILLTMIASCNRLDERPRSEFEVLDITSGNTLEVRPKTARFGGNKAVSGGNVALVGIWSDAQREPSGTYARRVDFMKAFLRGRTVRLSTTTVNVDAPIIFDRPESPTEALLEDGTSINEVLLTNGYAILDEGTDNGLRPDEFNRFRKAEDAAIKHGAGIWATKTASYTEAKVRMFSGATYEASYRKGLVFFARVQGVLFLAILLLMFLLRNTQPAVKATSFLFAIPLSLLIPLMLFFEKSTEFRRGPLEPSTSNIFAFHLIAAAVLSFGIVVFIRLVYQGPASQWGAVASGARNIRSLLRFFVGLWSLIVLGIPGYLLAGAGSLIFCFLYSSSVALGLPLASPVHGTATPIIVLLERISFTLWLGFSAATIKAESILTPRKLPWNIAVAAASLLIVGISTASIFSLLLHLVSARGGSLRMVNLSDCFWLSLATLFRNTYMLPADNLTVRLLEALEVHIALFLSLIGFKVVYSLARNVPSSSRVDAT